MEQMFVQLGAVLHAPGPATDMSKLHPGVDPDEVRQLDGDGHVIARKELPLFKVTGAEDPRPRGADVHQRPDDQVVLGRAEGHRHPAHPIHSVGSAIVLLLQGLRDRQTQAPAAIGHPEALQFRGRLKESDAIGKPHLQARIPQPVGGVLPAHGGCHLDLRWIAPEEGRLEPEIGGHQDQHLVPLAGPADDLRDGHRIPDHVAGQDPSMGVPASIMQAVLQSV